MKSAASVRARLTNIAYKAGIPFQQIIFRYLHERLIYRLSKSDYAHSFILKGGNLLYANQGLLCRPTKDIDYLAVGIHNDINEIIDVFRNICIHTYLEDHVFFDTDAIGAEVISEHDEYQGLRVFVMARFGTIAQNLQIDIAFGDTLVPGALLINYPVLLSDLAVPTIKAYSIETVIAEKFQAMIDLAELNSRMKDFFDVYILLNSNNYKSTLLIDAVKSTFSNRQTRYTPNHSLFAPEFANEINRNKMWKAFLKKINSKTTIPFTDVMQAITIILKPVWEELK